MTLTPLLDAPFVVQIHAGMALFAILLTSAIFTLRRGTWLHRIMGRVWVASMALVALSSFWINGFAMVGPFGPIHLISVFVLVQLFSAVRAARAGDIKRHQSTMKSLVIGGLVVAGAFTFFPGRTMYQVVLGG